MNDKNIKEYFKFDKAEDSDILLKSKKNLSFILKAF